MNKNINVDDLILNYDPEAHQERFLQAGVEAASLGSEDRLPATVPWPAASKPVPVVLDPVPAETDDLSRFTGYDAVIVTWTSAEAAALAALLTPGHPVSTWYEYRHNVAEYVPLVTGPMAPFQDDTPDMARYYHSLGLYFPCTIGPARVLLLKSGLHLDYDGPAVPVRKMIAELLQTVQPKLFITTGTGGGIGAEVALGDVVIAGRVRFDCQTQFKNAGWVGGPYNTSSLPTGSLEAITPALTRVNAAKVVGGRATPKFWATATDTIVTTDFFGFDDSTDFYKLQGNGACACDMGDAMIGLVMQDFPDIAWHAIRNASDPQIPNPTNDIQTAKLQAGEIYTRYGAFTTAASVIASWAIVDATFNSSSQH
jgi:nucleoside phosphorylase